MSEFYDLPTSIQANGSGHIACTIEQNRRLNVVVTMPAPSSDPAVNVANFDTAVTKATGANGYAGTIVFPPGVYKFNSTLRVYSSASAVFTNGVPGDMFGNDKTTDEVTGTTLALLA